MILCNEHVVSDTTSTTAPLFCTQHANRTGVFEDVAFLLVGANVAGYWRYLCWLENKPENARPIDHMISDANTINSQRLNRRLDVPEAEDELQKLSMTINSMLDRMEEAFRLQGRFAADASHELRTPLSILQGNADMLERWGRNDPVVFG
jgi:signal transduction histidine kinase